MPEQRITLVKIGLIVLIPIIFSQCSMYQNVTGYFNTYYNARRAFSEAVTELEKNPSKDRDTNYFASYNIPKNIEDKFDHVIEKCSKVIQFYPKSAWIDDAIMMIGKSYVYKNETESAIRKFNELVENFPESSLRFEAKMWNAIAYYQSKHEDDVLRIVKDLIPEAQTAGENDIAIEALMLQGQVFIDRDDLQSAINSFEEADKISGDKQLLSFTLYKLGLCYERIGDDAKAAEAYGKVNKYSPNFSREFQSKLREGVMLSKSGKYNDAFSVFDDLRDLALKPEEKGLIELETANNFRRMGDTAKAFELYDVIDTVYKRSDASAKSYYERGLFFEHDYPDYKQAQYYYDKAKVEYTGSEITPDAVKRSQYLATYFKNLQNIVRFDSLLQIRLLKDSLGVTGDSLSSSGDSTATVVSETDTSTITQNDSSVSDQNQTKEIVAIPETESYDQLEDNLQPLPDEISLQQAKLSRRESGGMQTLHDNYGFGENNALNDSLQTKGDTSKNFQKPIGKDPLASVSADSLTKLTAQTKFELAGLLYLEMDLPDSALYYYQDLVNNYAESKFTPRAYYTMAEIYHDKNDSTMVDSLTKIILNRYSETEYADKIKKTMGLEVSVKGIDPADSVYRAAENYLQNNESDKASNVFFNIVKDYPSSELAAKSLFTIGWIQESILFNNDSAASIYKQLIKDYPNSIYAQEVKPKVAVKDDPKSLDKYVKIKEIPALAKVDATKKDNTKDNSKIEKDKDKVKEKDEEEIDNEQPDQQDEDAPEEDDSSDEDDSGGD